MIWGTPILGKPPFGNLCNPVTGDELWNLSNIVSLTMGAMKIHFPHAGGIWWVKGYPKVSPFKVEPSILTVTNQSTAIAPVANGLNRETLEGIDFCQREEDHLGSCTGPLARDCSKKFSERRTCQILGFTATNPDAPNCSVQVSSRGLPIA